MFRVEFMCDDKKLGAAFLALVGIAIGEPAAKPIANAIKKGKGVRAKLNGARSVDLFADYLKKNRVKEMNAVMCRAFCKEAGLSERSYSNVLDQARKNGLIRKTGKGLHVIWKVL